MVDHTVTLQQKAMSINLTALGYNGGMLSEQVCDLAKEFAHLGGVLKLKDGVQEDLGSTQQRKWNVPPKPADF